MEFKTEFVEFEVKIGDAVFKLREDDPSRFIFNRIRADGNNRAEINIGDILAEFIPACLVGWQNVISADTKQPIPFTPASLRFLPVNIQSALWAKFLERCSLTDVEKKI